MYCYKSQLQLKQKGVYDYTSSCYVYIIQGNMNLFSLVLTTFSIIYFFLGIKVLQLDKRSALNRLFFVLNLSLIIWSFASAFYISASDEATCILWYKVSSIGAFSFCGILLHFFLKYIHKDNLLKKWLDNNRANRVNMVLGVNHLRCSIQVPVYSYVIVCRKLLYCIGNGNRHECCLFHLQHLF